MGGRRGEIWMALIRGEGFVSPALLSRSGGAEHVNVEGM